MKVAIIGAGRVGSATAFALVARASVAELLLVGENEQQTHGDALDLLHASAFVRPAQVSNGRLGDVAGCDVIVVTASLPPTVVDDRRSGMQANANLLRRIIPALGRSNPGAVFLIVTNPVDVMTTVAVRAAGLPWQRVIGTGTLVDTARFRALLGEAWNIHTNDVRAYMLGEHGDTQFPALSVASAGGVRIRTDDPTVATAAEEARLAGYRVVRAKGYTNYAVAMSIAMIVEAIAADAGTVLPVSVLVDGYLGVSDVCISLPCVVGRAGVRQILRVDLNDAEAEQFRRSAEAVRAAVDSVNPA
jgi:L-lactate dehydrogenase